VNRRNKIVRSWTRNNSVCVYIEKTQKSIRKMLLGGTPLTNKCTQKKSVELRVRKVPSIDKKLVASVTEAIE
jgi:hypothetical protein